MQKPEKKEGFTEKLNEFIQKHRKPLYICFGAIIVLFIAGITAISLMDVFRERAINAVEDLSSRYDSLSAFVNEEFINNDLAEYIADLEQFARRNSGYAGARAWTILGTIYSERSEWEQAEAAWVAAAGKSAKSYLAPLAWFNAGVAAEEQGKLVTAIDHYSQSLASPAGFSAAPRAQFTIGRLWESLDEPIAAINAYRAVIFDWPFDQVWTNLAHSRIIILELNSL